MVMLGLAVRVVVVVGLGPVGSEDGSVGRHVDDRFRRGGAGGSSTVLAEDQDAGHVRSESATDGDRACHADVPALEGRQLRCRGKLLHHLLLKLDHVVSLT